MKAGDFFYFGRINNLITIYNISNESWGLLYLGGLKNLLTIYNISNESWGPINFD